MSADEGIQKIPPLWARYKKPGLLGQAGQKGRYEKWQRMPASPYGEGSKYCTRTK